LVAGAVFAIAFTVVSVKLVDASLYDPARTVRISAGFAEETPLAPILRANLVDRRGDLIATSLPVASLCARPKLVRDPAAVAHAVAFVLPNTNAATMQAQLERGKDFVWLHRHITPAQHDQLMDLGLPGLCFEKEQRRVYPQNGLVSHVAGFADLDGKGLAGVERKFDELLNERAQPFSLSVDLTVQRIVREEVQKAMDRFRAIGGVGVLMRADTAEVISMVSLPDFDANDAGGAIDDARFNRATLGVYEMGSTFKLFTAAMALEAGHAKLLTRFDASKPLKIGRFTIRDFYAKNRWLTVEEILIHSSNIGAARMAELSGPAGQRAFMGKLGMLQPVALEVSDVGSPLKPRRWGDTAMLTISFGHGLAVTPVHMTAALSALVNGGIYRQPTVVKRLPGEAAQGKRIVSEKVSDDVRWLMRQVVVNGTGWKADTAFYPVGGKTGTAEKARGRRGYDKNEKLASFIAAFPIHDPKYVLLVMVDEPKGRKDTFGYATGGWVAAPAVKAIIERSGPALGLEPIGPEHPARQSAILSIKKRPKEKR
jgi:cell division protein FtsI (penicillin-binding protein 3)